MISGVIYKITNKINSKSYIGQTIRTIEKRWKEHLKNKSHCSALSSAIKKYGAENFEIKVLAICSSIEELNHRESYYIRLLNTLAPTGYNLDTGGDGKIVSEETRKRMSRKGKDHPMFGKTHKKESLQQMSKSHKGRKHTKETGIKISKAHTGRKHTEKAKHNMSQAQKKIPKKPHVMAKLHEANKKKSRSVVCNETGEVFESLKAAARAINSGSSNISRHIRGIYKYRHVKGFTFYYYEDSKHVNT